MCELILHDDNINNYEIARRNNSAVLTVLLISYQLEQGRYNTRISKQKIGVKREVM